MLGKRKFDREEDQSKVKMYKTHQGWVSCLTRFFKFFSFAKKEEVRPERFVDPDALSDDKKPTTADSYLKGMAALATILGVGATATATPSTVVKADTTVDNQGSVALGSTSTSSSSSSTSTSDSDDSDSQSTASKSTSTSASESASTSVSESISVSASQSTSASSSTSDSSSSLSSNTTSNSTSNKSDSDDSKGKTVSSQSLSGSENQTTESLSSEDSINSLNSTANESTTTYTFNSLELSNLGQTSSLVNQNLTQLIATNLLASTSSSTSGNTVTFTSANFDGTSYVWKGYHTDSDGQFLTVTATYDIETKTIHWTLTYDISDAGVSSTKKYYTGFYVDTSVDSNLGSVENVKIDGSTAYHTVTYNQIKQNSEYSNHSYENGIEYVTNSSSTTRVHTMTFDTSYAGDTSSITSLKINLAGASGTTEWVYDSGQVTYAGYVQSGGNSTFISGYSVKGLENVEIPVDSSSISLSDSGSASVSASESASTNASTSASESASTSASLSASTSASISASASENTSTSISPVTPHDDSESNSHTSLSVSGSTSISESIHTSESMSILPVTPHGNSEITNASTSTSMNIQQESINPSNNVHDSVSLNDHSKKSNERLPQTGNQENSKTTMLGLAALGLTGIFGFGKKRKKKND